MITQFKYKQISIVDSKQQRRNLSCLAVLQRIAERSQGPRQRKKYHRHFLLQEMLMQFRQKHCHQSVRLVDVLLDQRSSLFVETGKGEFGNHRGEHCESRGFVLKHQVQEPGDEIHSLAVLNLRVVYRIASKNVLHGLRWVRDLPRVLCCRRC